MSQVNTKTLMLGQNADQSKNFKITVPTPEDGTLTIERANGTDVMLVAANGKVSFPGNVVPAFRAVSPGLTWGGADIKLLMTTEQFDTNNCYDAPNSRFQPTVAGYYMFAFRVQLDSGSPLPAVKKNGAIITYGQNAISGGGSGMTDIVHMNGTTDYLELWSTGPASSILTTLSSVTYWGASLVRAE